MELRHLRSFLTLAEELHFGRAAGRLGIAQPALSRHVQQLEAEIGAALFNRTPRAVTLTAAGEKLRERAGPHVEGLRTAIEEAKAASAGLSGRLRVGYVSNLSYVFLPRLLAALREQAPLASVDLHEMPTGTQVDALRAGRIDLSLATLPVDDPGLIQRALYEERLIVVVSEGHPLALQEKVRLAQLTDEPFVMCPRYRRSGFQHVILERCAAAGFDPRIVQEVEGKALLVELVARGLGVSLVPESSAQLARPGVVYRPLADTLAPIQIAAVWVKENKDPLRTLVVDTAIRLAATPITTVQRGRFQAA